jgi:hypothetical protein
MTHSVILRPPITASQKAHLQRQAGSRLPSASDHSISADA